LVFERYEDSEGCYVSGIGACKDTDIVIPSGKVAAALSLNGSYAISSIYTTADTLITLGDAANDINPTITTITLIDGASGTSVAEGEQLVTGSTQADTIFTVVHGETEYALDNAGCLVAKGIALKHGDTTTRYETLTEAVQAAVDEDTIVVEKDVTLDTGLAIGASVTITTDGVADRTIYCGAEASSNNVISVSTSDIEIIFEGKSENSRLIFDGNSDTVTLSKYFIYPGTKDVHAKKVVMQYVTMQNVKSSSKYGSAICSYSPIEAQNCTFVECESTGTDAAGGAIYLGSTSTGTKFTNCQFKKCTTSGRGGAIYSEKGIDIISCTFGDKNDMANGGNTATKAGGAICIGNENVLNVESCKFYGNKSNSQFGGAVAMRTGTSTVSLSGKVVFESNTAKGGGYGGGAIMTGKALIVAADANVTIKNNTTEDLGGGIYFNAGATPTFTLGDGAVLTMSGNTDKNGSVNIAVKAGMLQAGSRFIIGNNVTDRISNVNVGNVTYSIDAEGKLMAVNQ